MIRTLGAILLFGFALGFALYHLVKFTISINNPKSKLLNDLKLLANVLKEKSNHFLPTDLETLQSLSAAFVPISFFEKPLMQKGGTFVSVFEEPVFAFLKEKTALENVYILAFKSESFEMQCLEKDGYSEVYQSGLLMGKISSEYVMADPEGENMGAIVHHDGNFNALMLGDKCVAKILKPHMINVRVNDRILTEVDADGLNNNEKIKSLLFYYLQKELT
ncbi:MAG: hypothetical protein KDC49_10905 [Saprospiraceae bacterium]|nr:hypothetical protein [Saprospiraceae bacterium]